MGVVAFNHFDMDVTNTTWELSSSADSIRFDGFPVLEEPPLAIDNEHLVQLDDADNLGVRVVLERVGS